MGRSPFKRSKKARRRWRNAVRDTIAVIPKFEESNPQVAASLSEIAKIYKQIGQAKRGKRPAGPTKPLNS